MARRGTRRLLTVLAALPAALLFFVALGSAALGSAALGAPAAVGAAPRSEQAQGPAPKAFLVADAGTGSILLADKPHDAFPPASIAKVMTALTAAERLPADAAIPVSPLAAGQPASRINMKEGQSWPFEQAIASLLMASANDSAYALAEAAGGSLDGFVTAMNQSADRMGMKDSSFSDPAGLDDEMSFRGGPRMSAYDIAVATRNAMAVPEIARWAGLRTYEFVDPTGLPRSLTNHNRLLPGGTRAYPFATGLKTGFTERAGHTLTATATRDGRSLIVVIIDTYDIYGWAAQLFDQAFALPPDVRTGEELPEVAVRTYGQRIADRDAFAALLQAPAPPATPPSTAPPEATTTSRPAASRSVVDGDPIAIQQQTDGDNGDGGGFRHLWLVVLVVVVVVVLTIIGRRRVVRRQRDRRIERQRLRTAKMRSGGLTVVDGRYRVGDRVGPPLDSEVRIRRDDTGAAGGDDQDKGEPRQ